VDCSTYDALRHRTSSAPFVLVLRTRVSDGPWRSLLIRDRHIKIARVPFPWAPQAAYFGPAYAWASVNRLAGIPGITGVPVRSRGPGPYDVGRRLLRHLVGAVFITGQGEEEVRADWELLKRDES
jgi:hypothetical protein